MKPPHSISARRARQAPGFTLIEVMAVVVIISLTGALVVPEISQRNDLKAAAGARIIMADLIYAQNQAINTQKTQLAAWDLTHGKYTLQQYVSTATPTTTTLTQPIDNVPFVKTFGAAGSDGLSNCTLVSAAFVGISGNTQNTLAFDDLGTPLAFNTTTGATENLSSAAIVLQCGTYKLKITITPYTGQMSVAAIP